MTTAKLLALVALVALVLVAGLADAKDLSKRKDAKERDLKLKVSSKKVDISAAGITENGTVVAKAFRFTFTTAGYPRFRLRRSKAKVTDEEFEAAGFQFMVGFLELIEYEESDSGTEGFESTDTVHNRWKISRGSNKWSNIDHTTSTVDGADCHQFATDRTENGGTYTLEFVVCTTPTNYSLPNGRIVATPNSMEVILTIQDFPFTNSNSRLAILAGISGRSFAVSTNTESDPEPEDPEQSVDVGDSEGGGFFQWDNRVLCTNSSDDTTEHQVIAQTLLSALPSQLNTADKPDISEEKEKDEEGRFIIFSIPCDAPTKIYWDPEIGVSDTGSDDESSAAVATPSVLALLLLSLAFLAMRQFD